MTPQFGKIVTMIRKVTSSNTTRKKSTSSVVALGDYVSCPYYNPFTKVSKICGLGETHPVLCDYHKATGEPDDYKIIEKPTYDSLDEAAMVAANIILHHVVQNSTVEYGISIYGNERNNEFCLVETKQGSAGQVKSEYEIKTHKEYKFKADVHSHPITDVQEFSATDYILSCKGFVTGDERTEGENLLERFVEERPLHTKYLVSVDCNNCNEHLTHETVWVRQRIAVWKSRYGFYKKHDIVFHEGNLLVANKDNISMKNPPEYNHREWTKQPKYRGNWEQNDKYELSDIVQYKDGFWRTIKSHDRNKDNSPIPQWPLNDVRAKLIKFSPPKNKDEAKKLAIIMAIWSWSFANMTTIYGRWDSRFTNWEKFKTHLQEHSELRGKLNGNNLDNWKSLKKIIQNIFKSEYTIMVGDNKERLLITKHYITQKWKHEKNWDDLCENHIPNIVRAK